MLNAVLFSILTILQTYQDVKLQKVKIGEDITMKLPVDFVTMSDNDMQQRISSHRKSLALYTDMQRVIELGVNRSFTKWEMSDLPLLQQFYKSSLLEIYDEIEFYKEDLIEVNGQPFVVFEFRSMIKGDSNTPGLYNNVSKYTYLMYTVYAEDTYVFNFICPSHMEADWRGNANEIMNSVKFR